MIHKYACIVITNDMTESELYAALDTNALIILDVRTGVITETIQQLVDKYNEWKINELDSKTIPGGRNKPSTIEIK